MAGIIHFETFLLTGILLNLVPGNDTIFILTKSIAQGKKAGYVSALGIGTGCLVHTLLAAFGLSLIIAKSILVFNTIKIAGAAYLVYLGITLFLNKSSFAQPGVHSQLTINYRKIYGAAILTNILNPKVALFFIAFLPQFIDPHYRYTFIPFIILGCTFISTGTIWCLFLAGFSSVIFSRLTGNEHIATYLNKFAGITLLAMGIQLALTKNK